MRKLRSVEWSEDGEGEDFTLADLEQLREDDEIDDAEMGMLIGIKQDRDSQWGEEEDE